MMDPKQPNLQDRDTPVNTTPENGSNGNSPDSSRPSRPYRVALGVNGKDFRESGGQRKHGGGPPKMRELPPAGSWESPIEIHPGTHYKGFVVPPGYVPGAPPNMGGDSDEDYDGRGLLEYWRLIRRRKGVILLAAMLGVVAAVLVTLPMTPIYTARTSIEVQDINQNFLNMGDVQQFGNNNGGQAMLLTDIQTQIRVLQSDSLLDRVLLKLKAGRPNLLTPAPSRLQTWKKALGIGRSAAAEPSEEEALASVHKTFASSVKVRAQPQTRMVELTVDHADKKLATDLANTLVSQFIEQNMESRWQQTQTTGQWLTRQLDEMKIKLEGSEDALQEYARKSGLLFTQDQNSVREERLKQLQQWLSAASADRVAKQGRYEMARDATSDSLPEVIADVGLRSLEMKLTELRAQAAQLRTTYSDKYKKVQQLEPQIALLEKQFDRERDAILVKIKNEYEESVRKEGLLQNEYNVQAEALRSEAERSVHYNILKREVDSNRQLYESMLQKVKEASIASAIRASNIRVVDLAREPRMPSSPQMMLNASLGLFAGLLFGVGFVILSDQANRTIRDPGDVQFYLNLPELGVIPSEKAQLGGYSGKKAKAAVRNDRLLAGSEHGGGEAAERIELVVHQRKPSMLAESFRATLTSILFAGGSEQRPKALVFTSASPGEGKSTIVSNMAIALGEIHQRVLLIDADTRKPRQHDIFGVSNEVGLTTLLLDSTSVADIDLHRFIQPTLVDGVFILPAGPSVASATNLLYSGRMEEFLNLFSEFFDTVLIDTPPMLQIPDARVLGRMAGGIALVIRASKTTRDAAQAVRQRLQEDGTRILGTILNDWNPKSSTSGYYGYSQGYYKTYKGYYAQPEA